MKIAFLHSDRFFLETLERRLALGLPEHTLVSWRAGRPAPSRDIDVILVMGAVGRESMTHQANLAFIQTVTAGYETIDIAAATELGIWVACAPSGETGNAVSVAEWAIFLMLGAGRRIKHELGALVDRPQPSDYINSALSGKTACIVGLGAIGRALAERLDAFDMTLVGTDAKPQTAPPNVRAFGSAELTVAVRDADYVIVCAPASADNANLIGANAIAAMKRGAVLVNVARGSLVDEDALARALASGHLAAAGLDVLKIEPADPRNPLLAMDQVLITPHIAGGTDLMLAGTVAHVIRAIDAFAAGRKPAALLNAPPAPRRPLK